MTTNGPVSYFVHAGDQSAVLTSFSPTRAHGIEIDVRMTRDGKIIIRHDRRIKGLYGRTMWVDRLTYEDILHTCEEKPLLLKELIQSWRTRYSRPKKFALELDIKQYDMEEEIIEVLRATDAFSYFTEIIISSPAAWVLQRFSLMPEPVTLALTDAPLDRWDLWDLKAYRWFVLSMQYTLRPLTLRLVRKKAEGSTMPVANVFHQIIDRNLVEFLHEQNVRIHAYGARRKKDISRLENAGVDVVKVKRLRTID